MKFNFKFMSDIRECNRGNHACDLAMHPNLESTFYFLEPGLPEGHKHQHVAVLSSTGFQFLADIEESAKIYKGFEGCSHFAFRNTVILMVDSRWMSESGELDDESTHDFQLFVAHYLAAVYELTTTVGVTLNRIPTGFQEHSGVTWITFMCNALMPVPEEEWVKTLTIRQQEVKWAEVFLANKKERAEVEEAAFLSKLGVKLH